MNHEMMIGIFENYMLMKRDAIQDPDVDNDVPMLLYLGERPYDDPEGNVLCIIVPGGRNDMCQALAAAMARMFIPYWAAIASDGYVAKDADVPPEYKHAGGLVDAFAAGFAVKECLSLTASDATGETYAISRSYWYDDDGDIWFDDEDGPSTLSTGPMIAVLVDVTSLYGKSYIEVLSEIIDRMSNMN